MSDKISTKERIQKKTYRLIPKADRIETSYYNEDKLVHRIVSKSRKTRKMGTILEYQKKNPDKVKLLNITFKHIGLLSIWYYKNDPYDLFIGNGVNYDRLDKYELKKIWGSCVRAANHIRLLGRNNENAMQERLDAANERAKKATEELERFKAAT